VLLRFNQKIHFEIHGANATALYLKVSITALYINLD
jgi:hypothetical protein